MIGFVVVSDQNQKPTLNMRACAEHGDNPNAALIAFNWPFFTSTRALGLYRYIMGH